MRHAVTLLEVLISILVAAVGLLGALAVFPVALSQARKGQTADISAVAGESAVAAFRAQGMHEPQRWLAWDEANQQTVQVPADFQESTSPYFGYAFCIDPALFAHNAADDPANGAVWSYFPAVPATAGLRMKRLSLRTFYLGPDGQWGRAGVDDDQNGIIDDPGEFLAAGSDDNYQPVSELMANKWFGIEDELIYDRPDDESLPAAQLFTDINGQPGRRQEEGRLTWFATLVPKIDRLQSPIDAAGTARLGDEYVLSIAICRGRATGEALHVNNPANPPEHPWNEWTAKIKGGTSGNPGGDFHGSGIGGGEVTITTNDPATDATFNKPEYLDLRSGQWILLGRTIPGAAGAIQHYQWYRVSGAAETLLNGNRWSQDVSLVGGDWPADLLNTLPPPQWDFILEECDVVIMPSVVHVFERTIRLSP